MHFCQPKKNIQAHPIYKFWIPHWMIEEPATLLTEKLFLYMKKAEVPEFKSLFLMVEKLRGLSGYDTWLGCGLVLRKQGVHRLKSGMHLNLNRWMFFN